MSTINVVAERGLPLYRSTILEVADDIHTVECRSGLGGARTRQVWCWEVDPGGEPCGIGVVVAHR